MKKTVISEEGIGTIINRFEVEQHQNIETFNRLFFNCRLAGFDPSLNVTIGEYDKGRRVVTIGDTITVRHEFSLIDLTLSEMRSDPFILKHKEGEFIGTFKSYSEAASHLNMDYAKFRNFLAKSMYILEELNHE